MVLHVLAGAAALEVAGRAREEADLVDGEQDLVVDEGRAGLAGVLRFEVGELLGARLHRVRDPEECELAFARGGLAPDLEGVAGGGDTPRRRRLRSRPGDVP